MSFHTTPNYTTTLFSQHMIHPNKALINPSQQQQTNVVPMDYTNSNPPVQVRELYLFCNQNCFFRS